MPANAGRVLLVAGARPNFMKVAPILSELESRGVATTLVHTGQHYSPELSGGIFEDLGLRDPDINLAVGSGSHAQQTARVMEAFEPVLLDLRPSWVVVAGDVNSTLACALVTAKLQEETGSRLAHVEAGLRSSDWRMPEEINRVLTDRLSDLLLTPSRDAGQNLVGEGIPPDRIVFVGNVMMDTLFKQLPKARSLQMRSRLGLPKSGYAVVTLHRPSNVDSRENLTLILEAIVQINEKARVVLPLHPRTLRRAEDFGLKPLLDRCLTSPPLGYLEMLSLTDGATVVLTDSGGLQEETTVLGVPCVTLRERTERPVTLAEGTNRMAPWPLTVEGIVQSFVRASEQARVPVGARCPEGWDGSASRHIADALQKPRKR
jgi:UDP-N-acetylglucosamine 2-epimerase (non-hydrolysing)